MLPYRVTRRPRSRGPQPGMWACGLLEGAEMRMLAQERMAAIDVDAADAADAVDAWPDAHVRTGAHGS